MDIPLRTKWYSTVSVPMKRFDILTVMITVFSIHIANYISKEITKIVRHSWFKRREREF